MNPFKKIKQLFSCFSKIEPSEKHWVDREPRILSNGIEGVLFIAETDQGKIQVHVANVSFSGIALIQDPLENQLFSSGEILRGKIIISEKSYTVSLKVVRIDRSLIGCEFVEKSVELEQELKEEFDIELAGTHMNRMRDDLLAAVPNGTPHCFNGKHDCRLYYIQDGDAVVQFDVSVFGNVIEGFQGEKLRYGNLYADRPTHDIRKKKTLILDTVHSSSDQIRGEAIRFIQAIELLDKVSKESIIRAIQTGIL